ncbi:MAG: ATP-binding cassette domain-containing protein [Clostridia bacterium]|nr:ATP-binding cassette domain-containing protein [Clostridia bacterium]
MGWFEEQLKQRKEADNQEFLDAIDSIANAVMGKRLADSLSSKEIAKSAIEEILKFYHHKMTKVEPPKDIDTIDEQLEYYLRPHGIMRRNVTLDKGWYKNAVGAMIGTLKEDGSAVAFIPGKLSGYTYLDLKTGKKVKVNRNNQNLFDEQAVCFYKALPLRSLTIKDLMIFMLEQFSVSDIVLHVGMMGIMALVGLISPLLTKWLFGIVLESENIRMLIGLASFMICYSVARILLESYQMLVSSRVTVKQNIAVQAAIMSRMMSLPATFFKGYASGELSQRSQYVQSLCSLIMNNIANIGLTSLFSLIYIGQIVSFAPALVIPSVCITLATIILGFVTTYVQTKITRERMTVSAKESGLVYSTITGIQKIKLSGAEKRMFSRWANLHAKTIKLTYNTPAIIKLNSTINLAISLIGTIVLYYCAVKSNCGVANYYAFNASYGMISGAFFSFASIATTLANIKPTLDMARPILEAVPEISDGKEVVAEIKGNIELSNVYFRYTEDMPYVINNLSLKIKAGEYLAIVGSTGCGKSTLMRLLLGFETPEKGSIYYDRKDITKVDLKSLRRKIGTVTQDGKLFSGDIYSNIVISAPQLTLDEAWEAAEMASIADDIRAMPMGMNTLISEGQGGISGGQKQRLMIARALAPKPKVLMFDEATSALDNITQKKVSDAIDTLSCTRIVIAHRLSTIRNADRIIYLKDGQVVESGDYETLIANKGYFADLVKRQRLDIDVD